MTDEHKQTNVFNDFYLVGYATVAEITDMTYNGLQIIGNTPGALTIDGIVIPVFAIVLVKDQSDKKQNGIYRQTRGSTGSLTYRLDRVRESLAFRKGKPIYVLNGTDNEKTSWITVHDDEYIVTGITEISYCTISSGGGSGPGPGNVLATYPLRPTPGNIFPISFTNFGSRFAWDDSRYSGYTSGIIIAHVIISNRSLSLRYFDIDNAVVLGQLLNITGPFDGIISFPVSNPTTDAELTLQAHKSANGGVSPQLQGVQLEFIQF